MSVKLETIRYTIIWLGPRLRDRSIFEVSMSQVKHALTR